MFVASFWAKGWSRRRREARSTSTYEDESPNHAFDIVGYSNQGKRNRREIAQGGSCCVVWKEVQVALFCAMCKSSKSEVFCSLYRWIAQSLRSRRGQRDITIHLAWQARSEKNFKRLETSVQTLSKAAFVDVHQGEISGLDQVTQKAHLWENL